MLARMQKSLKEKDQGFTLIELLVVIVIIGILAAIAIPIFLNQQKKGVDASLKSDVKNAATTVESWKVDNPTTDITADTAGDATPGALDDVRPSDGNTVILMANTTVAGAYCVYAYNDKATDAVDASNVIIYDSNKGGLQSATPTAPACAG
jgi:type IV pilus assembly protein PilA